MMEFLQLLLITMAVFFPVDMCWLYCVINTYCIHMISHLMVVSDKGFVVGYASALVAYIILAIGLTRFVVQPCLSASYTVIFWNGALFGLCVYGLYEFTNRATLQGWPWTFLIIDVCWGVVWCGLASVISVFFARYFRFC